jgi:hypothetical protein
MLSNRTSKWAPILPLVVIGVTALCVSTIGNTLWYGIAVVLALVFAYFVATSTPELSASGPEAAPSKLKYIIFLCAFIAAILAVFVGRNYPQIPWPEDAASLSTSQVESLLRAHRTLLFGVCTLFAVAYLHVVLLILRYLRQRRQPSPTSSTPTAAPVASPAVR